MTTSVTDFDAAKAVSDQLKGMEKDRQHRILRWVAESLGLDELTATGRGRQHATGEAPAQQHGSGGPNLHTQGRQHGSTDIKTFVESKKPKSDVQFAAVVAYYYQFEAPAEVRKNSIDGTVLQEAARLAGRRRPPNARGTLNNAKTLGYLNSSERGQFAINSVGENLVAMTLPGSESDRPQRRTSPKAKKKAKPTKR